MKTILAFPLVLIFSAVVDAQVHQYMPGEQQIPNQPGLMTAQNPAQQTAPAMRATDLLQEANTRPAMQLEQFKQLALAANPTLKQAEALIRHSAGRAHQFGLWPNPTVGYEGAEIRGGSFQGGEQGAFVQQTFVLGGKLGLRRNVFKQQQREDRIGAAEQRVRILSDVERSYYAALSAQELVHVRRDLLGIATDAVETAHQLANVGQADAPDVLQAEIEEEQAQVEYTTAQRNYIHDFRALAALVAKPGLLLAPLAGDLESPPKIDPGGIIARILENSPEIKRAQQGIARAQAEIKSAKREAIPDLTVQAGLQQNFEPLNEMGGKPVGMQGFVTAGVALPIFNRNQGNVTAAEADRERAQAEAARVRLSISLRAEGLLQDYLSAQEAANRYKNDMIPRAERAYKLYLAKYRQMGAAYPEVLVSQRTLFQLRASYVSVLQSIWSAALALENYTLSGGLDAAMSSGTTSTTINLPGLGAGGGQ